MKVFTISMAYNDADIIEESIAQYYATKDPSVETEHILLDQHWPINHAEVKERLVALADRFSLRYIDAGKNLGLERGFNFALSQMNIPDNAGVIGFDPDCWPVTKGWDMAMCKVFTADPKSNWLSLWQDHARRELYDEGRSAGERNLGGIHVVEARVPCLNSICMWRMGWLRTMGGIKDGSLYYGGLEMRMWDDLCKSGGKWYFLKDYVEESHFHGRVDSRYVQWKWAHAHTKTFAGDFSSYLGIH